MIRRLRILATCFAILGLLVANVTLAEPQSKSKGHNEQKAKQHKHLSGKDLVGDKIKVNGSHKIQQHGKYSASVNVSKGKITGVKVKHAEKGDVPVTKYKSTQKMAQGWTSESGDQSASIVFAQELYLDTIWIGFAYIDDFGFEIIFWFPYDMVYDGDVGAIVYYPAA